MLDNLFKFYTHKKIFKIATISVIEFLLKFSKNLFIIIFIIL